MTVRILQGDCREVLKTLPDESVHCVVTSPPYFGLRDYGVPGQIGLEKSPTEYVAELADVFAAVRRVLRQDGTVWLNLGDSYAGSGRGGNPTKESSTLEGGHASQEASMVKRTRRSSEIGATARDAAVTNHANRLRGSQLPAGLHENARLAGAVGHAWVPPPAGLKEKDLIGAPWMAAFALRAAGWWLRSDIIWHKPNPMPESVTDRPTKSHEYIFLLSKAERYYYDADAIRELDNGQDHARNEAQEIERGQPGVSPHRGLRTVAGRNGLGRNKRSVWTINTYPYTEAHFATFPPALIEPCILAGCPEGGIVLDPFGGAGTTGLVADRLQRNAILIELNPEYAAMAERRIRGDSPLFAEIEQ